MVWGLCVEAGAFVEMPHRTVSALFHKARSMKHFTDSKSELAQQSSCVQVCWQYLQLTLQFNFALQVQRGTASGEQILLLLLSLPSPAPSPWLSLGWGDRQPHSAVLTHSAAWFLNKPPLTPGSCLHCEKELLSVNQSWSSALVCQCCPGWGHCREDHSWRVGL